MLSSIRNLFVAAVASPRPGPPALVGRRDQWLVGAAAAVLATWVFVHKLQCFWGLATTSDLYAELQQTTSWLEGRWFQDNCFGNIFRMHSYFLSPLLAVLTVPFGAVGLFIALALAVATQVVALVRVQRLLGVGAHPALAVAVALTAMPLATHVYQDDIYSFHLELLEPALAAWLAYYLLRRHWFGSMALTLVLILLKEDAPLLVIAVAGMVWMEDLVRAAGREWRRGWNWPAVTAIGCATVAVPLLLYFIKTQQAAGMLTNLSRVKAGGEITSNVALVQHVFGNLGTWLGSGTVAQWALLSLAATGGLILLRPHFLLAGVGTTLVAWLVAEDLLWSPRFAPALAFYQVAAVLGFASVVSVASTWRGGGRGARIAAAGLAGATLIGFIAGWTAQARVVPRTREVYLLQPALAISPADRRRADELFAVFRQASRKDEPVVASGYLFRYAHDRNLFWYDRLENRPRPVWILWDREQRPWWDLWTALKSSVGVVPSDYRVVGHAGRFFLLRHHSVQPAPTPAPIPAITGEAGGEVRLTVKFPAAFYTSSEPLLAVAGELFFARYFDDGRLALGWRDRGGALVLAEPVAYEPGRSYAVTLFSGSLLADRTTAARDLVHVTWDGREMLSVDSPSAPGGEHSIQLGVNPGPAPEVQAAFSGQILSAQRGGVPVLQKAPSAGSQFGPVRLVLDLTGMAPGAAEPLLVAGVAGDATLGYLRLLPDGRVRAGVEFWGYGALESEPFAVADARRVEVVIHLPGLQPPVGDWRWGGLTPEQQRERTTRCRVVVNGAVRLDQATLGPVARQAPVVFASNSAGGSWVARKFGGQLLESSRLPVATP